MWFAYILLCKDRTLYAGITNNLKKRLQAHKNGRGAKYTKSRGAEKIVYKEKFKTKSAAMKREYQIKGWSRKKKEELIKFKNKKATF